LWTLFLGQLDGIALLGLIGMPWLVPLALVKPHVTIFAFAARKTYLPCPDHLFVAVLPSVGSLDNAYPGNREL
jgi:hypothetical protein